MAGRRPFKKYKINEVFSNAEETLDMDSNQFRIDRHGRIIARSAYGNIKSKYGWNIHHIDEDHTNNYIENLEAVHYDTHEEIH